MAGNAGKQTQAQNELQKDCCGIGQETNATNVKYL